MDAELRPELRDSAGKMRERQAAALGEAPNVRLIAALKAWAPAIGWLTFPGILLALIGPFGTFAAPMPVRFLYWLPIMAAGGVLGFLSARALLRAAPGLDRKRVSFACAHALVVTALMVLVVWGWSAIVFPNAGGVNFSWALVFYVGVITFAISFIRIALAREGVVTEAGPLATADFDGAPPTTQALSRRLRPEFRAADILALEAEDHYVRVHTTAGTDLILLRLTDAIAEMGGTEGLRPHRSWWVARAAVTEARREDGRLVLALRNGLAAPVSRAAAADIRAALEGRS